MEYPEAVVEKAKRLEQLVLRVGAGEPLAAVNEVLGFEVDEGQLAELEAKYEARGREWTVLLDGRYGHAQKMHSGIREWLYQRKEGDEEVRAPQLAQEIKAMFEVEVDPGHVNYLLRKRGLSAPVGRPYKEKRAAAEEVEPSPDVPLDNAGIFFPGRGEGRPGRGGRDRRGRAERAG